MGWTNSCRTFGYLLLWALAVVTVTTSTAILVPSLAVLWLTFGQHQQVDQCVVRMVNEYDVIVVSTASLMVFCMSVDLLICLFGSRTHPFRLYLHVLSKIDKTPQVAQGETHHLYASSIPCDQSHTTNWAETLTHSRDRRSSLPELAEFQQASTTTAEDSLEDRAQDYSLGTDLAVSGLRVNQQYRPQCIPYTSQEFSAKAFNHADRVENEAEQAAIANEIHRLLRTDCPDVDPYFAPIDREEFESWIQEAEDVGTLAEMVTEWLRKRDDLQNEKDRLLLSFHMRGLDSTSRLCAQHDQ